MSPLIRVPFDAFAEVERMLKHRFRDKERERSNRAAGLAEVNKGTPRRCPLRHDTIAWSGPPHDAVRHYICLRCYAAASEPEIRDRGYDFGPEDGDNPVPDWVLDEIFDLDLARQSELGNQKQFFIPGAP